MDNFKLVLRQLKGHINHCQIGWLCICWAMLIFLCPIASSAQQNNEKVTQLLAQPDIKWKQYHSGHFRYFVEGGRYADDRIDSIKCELEEYRSALLPFFQRNDSLAFKTDIIIYHSEDQIKRALGFVVQGFAISEYKVLVFVHNERYKLAARHELAHYYAFHLWGKGADNGFSEGIAVYLDKTWSSHPIDQLSKHLKNEKRLIRIPNLLKDFFKFDAMIAYPQIGSFTAFLLDRYGKEKLYQIWQQGFKDAKKIYGCNLVKLEEQWLVWLDQWNADHIDYSRHI